MIISPRSLYDASWLFLPLLVLSGVLAVSCHARAARVLFKTTYYYLFGVFAIYTLIPNAHIEVRDLLLDLITRFYLLVQSAEQLWIEWSNAPGGAMVSTPAPTPQAQGQGEKPAPKQAVVLPTMPLTYKMRVVYSGTTLLYLAWLLLGVAFASTRL